jgi:hypothetical protein
VDRDQLSALLADLLARRAITSSEAARILDLFDAGQLVPEDLPVAAPQQSGGWLVAFAALLLLLGGNTNRTLTTNQRLRGANILRNVFDRQVRELGQQVADGAIGVGEWQTQMQNALAFYTRQMATVGAGTLPTAALQTSVEASLTEQWPFLQRFGTEILTRQTAERPMSAAAIVARSRSYGGVAYSAYWHGEEEAQVGGNDGFVVYYQSMDDPLVCSYCMDAEQRGPYLPGTNYPRPGQVCIARGHCRCILRFVYDPRTFAELSGRAA